LVVKFICISLLIVYEIHKTGVDDNMMPKRELLLRPFKEVEKFTSSEKDTYYNSLREFCLKRNKKSNGCNGFITSIAPLLRNFPIEIRGEDNIPQNTEVVFVGNHSNSHDFFVIKETFKRIKKSVTPLAAWDGLNILSRILFYMGNITFIKRMDKDSIEKGILEFCSKILNGTNGFILGEATWNLHPILPMQKVKAGVVQTAFITEKPIVPVIIEYIEVPKICKKEKELYSKCVVQFGKPIYVTREKNIFTQAAMIQEKMESLRKKLWTEFGIVKNRLDDIDKDVYLNHLYLKKFKAVGFKYNSKDESRFLLEKENEYYLDSERNFVPGILEE